MAPGRETDLSASPTKSSQTAVCHFPPGTSKWNKIEHRLFSFISSNWRGEPLRDYETIVQLICRLDRRKYPTGRKVSNEEMKRIQCLRWRIEDWHRVLKSGCRIEEIAHRSAERLSRAIAINLVIAWRIMLMTLLGRETPELPAEVIFSDLELHVLEAYAKKTLEPALATG